MGDKETIELSLAQKYEALLSGDIPETLKETIMTDKCNLLIKQNLILENTILSLRHQLSSIISRQDAMPFKPNNLATKIKACINTTDFELSQFAEMHSKALEAVRISESGLKKVVAKMKSKLFPPSEKILNFMNSVLVQVQDIRSQLRSVYNYINIVENNEKIRRGAQVKFCKLRSLSFNKLEYLERNNKKAYLSPNESPTTSPDILNEELIAQINRLKTSLKASKNQRKIEKTENEKMLMQLKFAKEQLAFCEEKAAGREVEFENKIKKILQVVGKERSKILGLINKE